MSLSLHTLDLDDYVNYPITRSCYLDGRYFNKVFANYPGLVTEPLEINIYGNEKAPKYTVKMSSAKINNRYPGLLRVIITTPSSRHSNLLILDYDNQKIYRYEPLGTSAPYYREVNKIVEQYMDQYMDFTLYNLDFGVNNAKNPNCMAKDHGFCVAYVIKFGYDYLRNRQFNPDNILKFASRVENTYGLLSGEKDEEYGFLDDPKKRNTLGGGILGGLVGGAVGGGTGALVGAVGGAILGNVLTD